MGSSRELCSLWDLSDGEARGFDPDMKGEDTVFVVRRGFSAVVWKNECPHLRTPLPWRKDAYLNADRSRIVCAAHGALFDVESGVCTIGPCLNERLTPILFSFTDDGFILID
ncbi:Rieske (2Fe-2S) protein [Burkholderia sp. Bp8990]|uniref:Rieske (2Fe-2S) protein n=1 Tax=Burkholderia sp. Bp8990 TaxID=2184552 RepID=UPI000F598600|nr:Rieske (2Fe-2S) protein [Burkholderia sp. Bp8990]RQS46309.1 Rieske (2Fe-2S) protein [Burkholderia sp. Bp8990]